MKDHELYIDLIVNEKIRRENIQREYDSERQLQLEIPQNSYLQKEVKEDVKPRRVIIIEI